MACHRTYLDGYVIDMKAHSLYTEADWQADQARKQDQEPLECPDCGFSGDYDRYGSRFRTVDGSPFPYRMCKVCGFWQRADGQSAPVRCWLSKHRCQRRLAKGEMTFHCDHCGSDWPAAPDGLVVHECGKYLLPGEDGYRCKTCDRWWGRDSQVGWPRQGSG